MKGRTWLEGCGAAILFTLAYTWFHISPLHTDLYHRLSPMNSVYCGVAVDLAVMCLLFALIFWSLEKHDAQDKTLWWLLLGAVLAARTTSGLAVAGLIGYRVATPVRGFVTACAAGLLLWVVKRGCYAAAVRSAQLVLLLLGFAIFWMLPELVYMAVKREPHDLAAYSRVSAQRARPERRIVWVLFDELSFEQAFEHRDPAIRLPNFDRFAGESVSFSNVQPAGYYTELIVPSLLWGNQIRQERSDFAGHAAVKTAGGWQDYPDDRTLFADAERAGLAAGAVGWYIPYCRTYRRELDWCEESLGSPLPGNYSPDRSVAWNIFAPLSKPLARLTGNKIKQPTTAQEHAEQYRKLMEWSRSLIADEDPGFLFIHLPVPHPGGFYNRRTGAVGVNGSYLDNLVLADEALGQLLQWIDETPLVSKTTVIVSSDHSWRVGMWKMSPMWTDEDERASQGRFDPRPVLMVRFPGSESGQKVTTPFQELRTHELIAGMIAGQMESNAELERWLGVSRR